MSTKTEKLRQTYGADIKGSLAQRDLPGGPIPGDGNLPTLVPDRYASATRARSFFELPVEQIRVESQPRESFDEEDLHRLASSIKRFGQLAPIRLRWDDSRGAWILLVGERRLRACKLAGLEKVRVELVDREMSQGDILAEQVIENAVRADLRPVESGRAYKRLMELNRWTALQVAEELGIEPNSVYRALALLKLPEAVSAAVDAGEIKPTAAYELSKLQSADDQIELAGQIVQAGLDHAATVEEVRRRKGTRKSKRRAAPKEQHFKGPRGVRVIVRASAKHKLEDIAADLLDIAARIRGELGAAAA